jgi:hypothetical protein
MMDRDELMQTLRLLERVAKMGCHCDLNCPPCPVHETLEGAKVEVVVRQLKQQCGWKTGSLASTKLVRKFV